MKIGVKLTITFFAIAFSSMLIISIIAYHKGKKSLKEEAFNRLTAVKEMKSTQIEEYFQLMQQQLVVFSADPTVVRAMKRFKKGFNEFPEDSLKQQKIKKVKEFIGNEFIPRLNKNSDTPFKAESETCTTDKGLLLQYQYIVDNPNPVGEKHKYLRSNDSSEYSKYHGRLHPYFKDFLEQFGFYDIFLVDNKTGNVVYTVFKEVDFGTSLTDGPFKTTNLADAFRHANSSGLQKKVQFEDFKAYHPSFNAPASFISTPIVDSGKVIGVLIFQLPIDKINNIMTSNHRWKDVGLGTTGETYLVGEDFKLRSQSRFFIEDSSGYFKLMKDIKVDDLTIKKMRGFKSTIGLQQIITDGTKAAIHGEAKNTEIYNDYRNVSVLSSFKPLKIGNLKWAIMSEIDEDEAFASIHELRKQVIIFSIILVILILSASYFVSKQITKPIKELTYDARQLQKGNFDVEINIHQKDEIGVLALSFKKMQHSMKKLIEELKHINQNLENKVIERTYEIQLQKEMVEHKNKEIVDSINYAKRLQNAILPPLPYIETYLPSSFVFYRPKDIVAGDFYWFHVNEIDEHASEEEKKLLPTVIICAADSTGHGVPGAMVSVVGSNSLDRCVKEFKLRKPSDILDKLTDLVTRTFDSHEDEVKDGMDISLCAYDPNTMQVQWAGANNPLWIVRKDLEGIEMIEVKADKQPIGKFDYRKPFTNHTIQLQPGDCVYMFTDGYADQFGGPKGKKFKYKTLEDLLISLYDRNMQMQHRFIEEAFVDWKKEYEQIDDVCIVGFRV